MILRLGLRQRGQNLLIWMLVELVVEMMATYYFMTVVIWSLIKLMMGQ